jgi:hypothetical protein
MRVGGNVTVAGNVPVFIYDCGHVITVGSTDDDSYPAMDGTGTAYV